MQPANLEAYWQFVWKKSQSDSEEIYQKYQNLINLLETNLEQLELVKVRTLHDPKDSFHIIVGMTKSGEWVGICPNIPVDFYDCEPMGIYSAQQTFLTEYQPKSDITANFISRLEPILQDLEYYEPEIWGYYSDKGWTVRLGASREFMIHSLLEAIGFARTFPVCKFLYEYETEYEEDEMEERELGQALDEFLQTNLTNLRTYIFGTVVSYIYYVIGQTSSGDWAGVTSITVRS